MTSLPRVAVYLDMRRVGVLTPPGPLGEPASFQYDAQVRDDPTAAISLRLPVRSAPYDEHAVLPCFENLLPDGELRTMLAARAHRDSSDVVGLLGVLGGECAGAITLWPERETPPSRPSYRSCTSDTLQQVFRHALATTPFAVPLRPDDAGGAMSEGLAETILSARMSMSGAQEKLALARTPAIGGSSPAYGLPVNGSPSTVLVKRERRMFPGLLQNELAGMTLMEAAGVETAAHTVCALDHTLYETARFDRVPRPDGIMQRLQAEDGCQLTGRRPFAKYAETGGPTYAELVTVLRRYSSTAARDQQALFRWAVANIAIGNRDAHAKNVTLLRTSGGWRLSPAYDVVCTRAYASLDDVLPIRFGGALHLAACNEGSLRKAAREFGLTSALARDLTADVCDRLTSARVDALHSARATAGDHAVLDVMDGVIDRLTAETRTRLLGG